MHILTFLHSLLTTICSLIFILMYTDVAGYTLCSSRGTCDFTTGTCDCYTGYSGSNCALNINGAYVQVSNLNTDILHIQPYTTDFQGNILHITAPIGDKYNYTYINAIDNNTKVFDVNSKGDLNLYTGGVKVYGGGGVVISGDGGLSVTGMCLICTMLVYLYVCYQCCFGSYTFVDVISTYNLYVYLLYVCSDIGGITVQGEGLYVTNGGLTLLNGLLNISRGGLVVDNGVTVNQGGLNVGGGFTVIDSGVVINSGGLVVQANGMTVYSGGLRVNSGGKL